MKKQSKPVTELGIRKGDSDYLDNLLARYGNDPSLSPTTDTSPEMSDEERMKIRKSALAGDIEAQFRLGEMYHYGEGVPVDLKEAEKWFLLVVNKKHEKSREAFWRLERMASYDNPGLQYTIGTMYQNGVLIERDYEQAVRWYGLAARDNHGGSLQKLRSMASPPTNSGLAQYELGEIYREGEGVTVNLKEAEKWFHLAVKQKHPNAFCRLQDIAMYEAGDANLQYTIATIYEEGSFVTKDDEKAAKWYGYAVERGHGAALEKLKKMALSPQKFDPSYKLGEIYSNGQGVNRNIQEAIRWYKLAIDRGDMEATYALGMMYLSGSRGAPQDSVEAVRLLQLAVSRGCVDAAFRLGVFYEEEQDVKASLKWYKVAASRRHVQALGALKRVAGSGSVEAILALGEMYENGLGVASDKKEAVRWYRLAVSAGSAEAENILTRMARDGCGDASFNLGEMCETGNGLERDIGVAVGWYQLAAVEQGYVPARDRLMAIARQGNCDAQFHIGFMYENGRFVEKNPSEAVKWYRLSVEQGHFESRSHLVEMADDGNASAQHAVGLMYQNGWSVAQNGPEAVKWYRAAADQSHAEAQSNLGDIYRNGLHDVVKNDKEALRWYQLSATQGHLGGRNGLVLMAEQDDNVDAQFALGVIYHKGIGIPKNSADAIRWYKMAGQNGHIGAQYDLAVIYAVGDGCAVDQVSAVHWYTLAGKSGHLAAQLEMGRRCEAGKGIDKSNEQAVEWYRLAADGGNSDAQYSLGRMYHAGLGVKQNDKEAFKWYLSAAQLGHVDAQADVGRSYQRGLGIEKNEKEALVWYRRAAKGGSPLAQDKLGSMYFKGIEVEKDDKIAFDFFRSAGSYAKAQYHLGRMYEQDRVVYGFLGGVGSAIYTALPGESYNRAKAREYYASAKEKGHKKAEDALDRLGSPPGCVIS